MNYLGLLEGCADYVLVVFSFFFFFFFFAFFAIFCAGYFLVFGRNGYFRIGGLALSVVVVIWVGCSWLRQCDATGLDSNIHHRPTMSFGDFVSVLGLGLCVHYISKYSMPPICLSYTLHCSTLILRRWHLIIPRYSVFGVNEC